MKAFLITPDHSAQTVKVEAVTLQNDGDAGCYQHLCATLDAVFIERVVPSARELRGHVAYVDENGLSKAPPGHILAPAVYALPLAGKIVIAGEVFDPEDGPTLAPATVDEETVRRLLAGAYVTRRYAKAAHHLAEAKDQAAYGDNSSVLILTPSKDM